MTFRPLTIFAGSLALILFTPVLALLYQSFIAEALDSSFQDLLDTVLFDYVLNSLYVVLGTLIFAAIFAIGPAWWCARYEFKGRNVLQWLMVFPLAIPAYISAYIYTDALDYAGPIQIALREWFGWNSPQDYWFFDVRSIVGANIMLGLALYPYVYLLLRNAFANQSDHLDHAARLMGANSRQVFFGIRLKLARPALAIGLTLVAMESLADFGTVHLFAISTLTTAIYDSWLVYGSLSTAAKISCLLLLFVVSLVGLERWQRRDQKHFDLKGSHKLSRKKPSNGKLFTIWFCCLLIISLGFIIPVLTLLGYLMDYFSENIEGPLLNHSLSTFCLALLAAIIAIGIALLLNSNQRFFPSKAHQVQQNVSSVGYAIPGTVLAIGILIPLGFLDVWINEVSEALGLGLIGLIFSGTSFALILAFVIRFAAIANGSILSGYQNISPNLDMAARSLNSHNRRIFKDIHLPLIKPATLTALLLVFIECVKELPAALLLRPFDFETLSTYVYQFASDEQLEQAALGALLIIIVSLLPIGVISKTNKMS